MRANVIAVVLAAALVLTINAAETHETHNSVAHPNISQVLDTCHASHTNIEEAAHIIRKINDLRNAVANGTLFHNITAGNMREIHWDFHLAESAREFAGHCEKNNSHHGERHGSHGTHSESPIKEITFVATSKCESFKAALFDKAFEIWHQGKSHLDHIHINAYEAQHSEERILSQLIWAETGHIGCGYANSEVHHADHKEYKQVIVCQFQTAGNKKGQPIFKVGKPCSACQPGTSCNTTHGYPHPALCINHTDAFNHSHFDTNHTHNHTRDPHNHTTECHRGNFDDAQKTSFVEALNNERERIASGKATPLPPSGNMHQLVWSHTLENSANIWAERCVHNMDVTKKHLNVSEVVFAMSANSSFSKLNEKAAINAMLKGHDQINVTMVGKFVQTTKEANIYAQVAWAKTTEVGCAYANLVEETGTGIIKRKQYVQVVVCHFAEQGDHPGHEIYQTGKNCQHCSRATGKCSDKYPNLCPI